MKNISLFFRDDDLGMDLVSFNKLMDIFYRHNQKLNAAAVPAILALKTHEEIEKIKTFRGLLEVHTHGFAHTNHQVEGKKCEFGSARDPAEAAREINVGKSIIRNLFPDMSFDAFTPPWNRMEDDFIKVLAESKFKILSRDGDKTSAKGGMIDLNVSIDLHTAKPKLALNSIELLSLVEKKLEEVEHVGVMLHHKHMEDADFIFLDHFLNHLNKNNIKAKFFSEIFNESCPIYPVGTL